MFITIGRIVSPMMPMKWKMNEQKAEVLIGFVALTLAYVWFSVMPETPTEEMIGIMKSLKAMVFIGIILILLSMYHIEQALAKKG